MSLVWALYLVSVKLDLSVGMAPLLVLFQSGTLMSQVWILQWCLGWPWSWMFK